jgi:hypothetical protein
VYLQSSDPDTILPLDGDQSTATMMPSWARHCCGFEFGVSGLIVRRLSPLYKTDCERNRVLKKYKRKRKR